MQSSGYGAGASEIQQFLAETAGTGQFLASVSSGFQNDLKYYPPSHSQQQQMTMPTQFSQFQSLPFTQFQLFYPHEHVPHMDSAGAQVSSSFLQHEGNRFKLNSRDGNGDRSEREILQHHHQWMRGEEEVIKEPSWRPLDINHVNNNAKRCKDFTIDLQDTSTEKLYNNNGEIVSIDGNNYKVFSELEAIYKPGGNSNSNSGSGSGLTCNELSLIPAVTATTRIAGFDASMEALAREDIPIKKFSNTNVRRRRKRRGQRVINSVASFFESLIKQLIQHQETLHRRFVEVVEKKDQEMASREAAWQEELATNSGHYAIALSNDRAMSACREASIVSFLEKISGHVDVSCLQDNEKDMIVDETLSDSPKFNDDMNKKLVLVMNNNRWPKEEVEALIEIRSRLEAKFQEPGLKAPLWDQISATMSSLGYSRSNKRCKEKWENINKYFKKTIESGKKKRKSPKTCPYFHQLEELYSKSMLLSPTIAALPCITTNHVDQHKDTEDLKTNVMHNACNADQDISDNDDENIENEAEREEHNLED